MVHRLLPNLPDALARWDETDPVVASLARRHLLKPALPPRQSAFEALVQSLIHQQISIHAGRTIHARVQKLCGGRVSAASILRLKERQLRQAGLSRQKLGYIRDLAAKVEKGEVRLRSLAKLTDAAVIEELTRVKGIGVWTAQMFLLFHLQRPDVLASGDLGLQLAVVDAYRVQPTKAKAFLEKSHAKWTPHASLASLALWASRTPAKRTSSAP